MFPPIREMAQLSANTLLHDHSVGASFCASVMLVHPPRTFGQLEVIAMASTIALGLQSIWHRFHLHGACDVTLLVLQAYQQLLSAKPKDTLLIKERDNLRAAILAASSSQASAPAGTSPHQPSQSGHDSSLQDRASVSSTGSIPVVMPMQTPDEAAAAAAAFQQGEPSSPYAMQQTSGPQPLPAMFEEIEGDIAPPVSAASKVTTKDGVTPSSLSSTKPAVVQATQSETMEAPADTGSAASVVTPSSLNSSKPAAVKAPQPEATKAPADIGSAAFVVTPSSLNSSKPAAVKASQPEAMEAPADRGSAASVVTPSSLNSSEPAAVNASQPGAMEAPVDTGSAESATLVKAQEAAPSRHDPSALGTVQATQPTASKTSADLHASAQPGGLASEAHQQLPETVQSSAGNDRPARSTALASSAISASSANTNASEADADAVTEESSPGNGLRQQEFLGNPTAHGHTNWHSDAESTSASAQVLGSEASMSRAMQDSTGAPAAQPRSSSEMNPPHTQIPANESMPASKPGILPDGLNDAAQGSPAPQKSSSNEPTTVPQPADEGSSPAPASRSSVTPADSHISDGGASTSMSSADFISNMMAKTSTNTKPDFVDAKPFGAKDDLFSRKGSGSAAKSAPGTSRPDPRSSGGLVPLEDFMAQFPGTGSMGSDPAETARQHFDDVVARAKAMNPAAGKTSHTDAGITQSQHDVPMGLYDPLAEVMYGASPNRSLESLTAEFRRAVHAQAAGDYRGSLFDVFRLTHEDQLTLRKAAYSMGKDPIQFVVGDVQQLVQHAALRMAAGAELDSDALAEDMQMLLQGAASAEEGMEVSPLDSPRSADGPGGESGYMMPQMAPDAETWIEEDVPGLHSPEASSPYRSPLMVGESSPDATPEKRLHGSSQQAASQQDLHKMPHQSTALVMRLLNEGADHLSLSASERSDDSDGDEAGWIHPDQDGGPDFHVDLSGANTEHLHLSCRITLGSILVKSVELEFE